MRAHGAVALAEHQTEGRGRLGRTWTDSALMFSVALYPPQPVARWPELTLVAARRGGRRDRRRRDDQAPERRARRRPQGGGHPRRGGRAGRARDRDQRRRHGLARSRLGRGATGSTCSSTCSTGSNAATTTGCAYTSRQRETPAACGIPPRRGRGAGRRPRRTPKVLAIHFTQDVNPVTQDWLNGQLSHAESHGYSAAVIVLDTPGRPRGVDAQDRAEGALAEDPGDRLRVAATERGPRRPASGSPRPRTCSRWRRRRTSARRRRSRATARTSAATCGARS